MAQQQKPAAQPAKIPQVEYLRDPYTYSAYFASIAPGSQQDYTINIKADADFAWLKGMHFCDLAGAAITWGTRIMPICTVLITDAGSGRQLMDQATPIANLFGNGDLPFILPQPKVFARSSSLTVTVKNYSAATTYTNLYLSLHGTLLFPVVKGQA